MFGRRRRREERAQRRRQDMFDSAERGLDMFAPERDDYNLRGLSAYNDQQGVGMRAEADLLRELQQRQQGGYGAGEALYRQQADDAARQAIGNTLSVSGMNPAAAAQIAMQNANRARLGSAADAAIIRAKEQQFADNAIGALSSGMVNRGLNANETQARLNDQYNSQRMNAANMFLQPEMQMQMQQSDQRHQGTNQIAGGLFNAGASLLGNAALFSDESLKTDIDRKDTAEEADSFLEALDVASYKYKDEKHGKGKHYSAMAQSVARSELGKTFVEELEDGLALDTRKGFGALLVSSKRLHDRIKKLEAKAA